MSAGRCIKKILKRTHLFRIFACSLFQLRRIRILFDHGQYRTFWLSRGPWPRPWPPTATALTNATATSMAVSTSTSVSTDRIKHALIGGQAHGRRAPFDVDDAAACAPPPHLQGNEVSERSVSWWHLQRKQTKELTCSLPSSPLLSWLIVVSTATATVVLMVAGPPLPPARRRNVQEKKIKKQIGEN